VHPKIRIVKEKKNISKSMRKEKKRKKKKIKNEKKRKSKRSSLTLFFFFSIFFNFSHFPSFPFWLQSFFSYKIFSKWNINVESDYPTQSVFREMVKKWLKNLISKGKKREEGGYPPPLTFFLFQSQMIKLPFHFKTFFWQMLLHQKQVL
jgi:hypothetical protein